MHQNEFRAQHISYTRYRIAPRWQDDFNWTLITKDRSDILLRDQYHAAVEWPRNRENQQNLPLGDNARVDVKLTSARYNKATARCDTTKQTQLCTDIMLTKMITCGRHDHKNEHHLNIEMEMINHFTRNVNINGYSYIAMKLRETNNSWTNEKPLLLEWTLMSLKTCRKLKLTLQNASIPRHQICLWTTDRLVNLHRTISRERILCMMTNRTTTEIETKPTDFIHIKRKQ